MTTVLLVDDNPKYLKEALPHYGYDVFTAGDGIQALKILSQNKFDIIQSSQEFQTYLFEFHSPRA